jgi:VIT1/CCC1 family predicted Fe2+/Mn2+ transporter
MKNSLRKGFSFGLTSGIITTLGLIIGLDSSTHSAVVVISGILIIAIADALSDAMGIHMSEESESQHTNKEIWEATVMTFLSKFFFAMTFVVPFLIFDLPSAITASLIWGLGLIIIFSFYVSRIENEKPWGVILEHLLITIVVIILTHYVGDMIRQLVI